MGISFRELTKKTVVNLVTGARLGYVCDMTFDFKTGCVLGFILPEKGVFKKEETFIPLKDVEKIGEDVVFVRVNSGESEEPCKKSTHRTPYEEDGEE